MKKVDNNLHLTYNKESYEQINKKISLLENQITDYLKLNKNQLPDILNNINNDNIQLKLKVDALTREISDHVFKIQKLEMQQKPSDGIPEIQEAKISMDDIYKIKTDYNSKINKLSDSLNLSLNQLHSFKECQVKDNQIINSRLTNFSKQLEENNEKIKSLQNEIEIFDNNFEKIQSGFNQLERTLQKIEQIENKTNSMEQGMLGFIESIGIIREKMEEQFGGLAEWKKSLLESISENMNNLKNYCDMKLQK
jgi:chromosome segregation ATPase